MLNLATLSLAALPAALIAARDVARAVLARTAGKATADLLDGYGWRQLLAQSCALADTELLREEAIDALIALDRVCFAMQRVDLGLPPAPAEVVEHDPQEGCGCDLCDAARGDLNACCDADHAAYLDALDGGPLPCELGWTPDLALPVANDCTLTGEAA